MDLETLAMAGKYLLGATGGLVSYIAGNYIIGIFIKSVYLMVFIYERCIKEEQNLCHFFCNLCHAFILNIIYFSLVSALRTKIPPNNIYFILIENI